MANTISLNSVVFGPGTGRKAPSNIEDELLVFGAEWEAINGELILVEDAKKWQWTLTWNNVDHVTRAAVRAVALLSATWTFVDHFGISYTVQCPKDGRYRGGLGIIGASETTTYYGVTLAFRQL